MLNISENNGQQSPDTWNRVTIYSWKGNSIIRKTWIESLSDIFMSKSFGHVSLKTYRGELNNDGYYVSFWPGNKCQKCTVTEKNTSHFHTYQDDLLEEAAFPEKTHLNHLDVDAINQEFLRLKNNRWSKIGSLFIKLKNANNCAGMVSELMMIGGVNKLFPIWKEVVKGGLFGLIVGFAIGFYKTKVLQEEIPHTISCLYLPLGKKGSFHSRINTGLDIGSRMLIATIISRSCSRVVNLKPTTVASISVYAFHIASIVLHSCWFARELTKRGHTLEGMGFKQLAIGFSKAYLKNLGYPTFLASFIPSLINLYNSNSTTTVFCVVLAAVAMHWYNPASEYNEINSYKYFTALVYTASLINTSLGATFISFSKIICTPNDVKILADKAKEAEAKISLASPRQAPTNKTDYRKIIGVIGIATALGFFSYKNRNIHARMSNLIEKNMNLIKKLSL